MRIAYFDCFAGISGDMTLGALLDCDADLARFQNELAKLPGIEFEIKVSKINKKGIQATNVEVLTSEEHHHRHLKDILDIITSSKLSEPTKEKALAIFRRLAEAEASVHGTSPEEVHFHEVGAIDAIVDIVGACILIELLGIEKIIASPLPMGHGFVEAAHGKIPLPAPATVELLKGVPIYDAGIKGELVTPTGAALISSFASNFGGMPSMSIQSTGYGAGKMDFPFPNVLRVLVGEPSQEAAQPWDYVSVVETNIDDMNPEFFELIIERLFRAGALDVFLTPIIMKKSRPGTLLSVICPTDKTDNVAKIMLAETTTFGIRISETKRRCLERNWKTVSTRFGEIRIKVGTIDGAEIVASPEFEDCRKAAETHAVPLRKVYEEALVAYRSKYSKGTLK